MYLTLKNIGTEKTVTGNAALSSVNQRRNKTVNKKGGSGEQRV